MLSFLLSYSYTAENTAYLPFNVALNPTRCFEKLKQWLDNNSFKDIELSSDFLEIFAKKEKFEYTFTVRPIKEYSSIEISVYGLKGRTNKKLSEVLFELKQTFN